MSEHTKDILACALRDAGLHEQNETAAKTFFAMADKAATGYYHDFLSPLDLPEMQLVADLGFIGTPAALALRARVIDSEFDATKEEADAWAESDDGRAAFGRLLEGK